LGTVVEIGGTGPTAGSPTGRQNRIESRERLDDGRSIEGHGEFHEKKIMRSWAGDEWALAIRRLAPLGTNKGSKFNGDV